MSVTLQWLRIDQNIYSEYLLIDEISYKNVWSMSATQLDFLCSYVYFQQICEDGNEIFVTNDFFYWLYFNVWCENFDQFPSIFPDSMFFGVNEWYSLRLDQKDWFLIEFGSWMKNLKIDRKYEP